MCIETDQDVQRYLYQNFIDVVFPCALRDTTLEKKIIKVCEANYYLKNNLYNIITTDFRSEFLRRIKIYNGNEYCEKLKGDSVLIGWNKKEYYQYDNLEIMINEILIINKIYKEMKN